MRVIAPGTFDLARQQLTIDNRSGTNAIIANDVAANAVPDGYTLLMFTRRVRETTRWRQTARSVADFDVSS